MSANFNLKGEASLKIEASLKETHYRVGECLWMPIVSKLYPQRDDFNFKKVDEIPEMCRRIAELLTTQPVFARDSYLNSTTKVINLKNYSIVRVCEIFNYKVDRFSNSAFSIDRFGNGWSAGYTDQEGGYLNHGMALNTFNDLYEVPLEDLKCHYDSVLERMKNNWEECSEQTTKEFDLDPNKFVLYTKKESFYEEDELICFIAREFFSQNFREKACCVHPPKEHSNKEQIYLSINKSFFDEVIEKFGFKLPK